MRQQNQHKNQEAELLKSFRLMNDEERKIALATFRITTAGRALPRLKLIIGGRQ